MGRAQATHSGLKGQAASSNDNANEPRGTEHRQLVEIPTSLGPMPASSPSQSGVTRIALAGVIEAGLIASLLQMWTEGASTGTLHVSADDVDGAVVLEGGEVASAQIGQLLGRAATFRILSLETGLFRYVRREPTTPPTSDQRAAARAHIRDLLLAWTRVAIETPSRQSTSESTPVPTDLDTLDRLSWPVDEQA